MSSSGLVVGLGSVFAGLTVVLGVLGFAYNPVALVLAVPFLVVTYFLWYHASGRLHASVRRQASGARGGESTGGFGAGPREEWTGPRRGQEGFNTGTGGTNRGRATAQQRFVPSRTESYRVLGLDPGADEAAVRSAYRERVKEVHPDTEEGNEQAFKRVNEAYERLSD